MRLVMRLASSGDGVGVSAVGGGVGVSAVRVGVDCDGAAMVCDS